MECCPFRSRYRPLSFHPVEKYLGRPPRSDIRGEDLRGHTHVSSEVRREEPLHRRRSRPSFEERRCHVVYRRVKLTEVVPKVPGRPGRGPETRVGDEVYAKRSRWGGRTGDGRIPET